MYLSVNSAIIGLDYGSVGASHYLNQLSFIVNWMSGNKLQCNLNKNTTTFIQENKFQNIVDKMVDILSQSQYVNSLRPSNAYMCQ